MIAYLLVAEGKHYLKIGRDALDSISSRMNTKRDYDNKEGISQQTIDLLFSDSNYTETEQAGILDIIESQYNISRVHTTNSYVLASNETDNISIGFKSNADCAKYFSVSKVTVARWINKNSSITTKKGIFFFFKEKKDYTI